MTHTYRSTSTWEGSTGVGYDGYERNHRVSLPAGDLELSGDAAFKGDPSRINPEQLLVAAAASCQLLSFLAVAARARIDVIAYSDEAEGVMPDDEDWITSVVLRTRITVRQGPSEDRIRHLVEVAHRECYIANSLKTEVRVEPEIVLV